MQFCLLCCITIHVYCILLLHWKPKPMGYFFQFFQCFCTRFSTRLHDFLVPLYFTDQKSYIIIFKYLYARDRSELIWRASCKCVTCLDMSEATCPQSLQTTNPINSSFSVKSNPSWLTPTIATLMILNISKSIYLSITSKLMSNITRNETYRQQQICCCTVNNKTELKSVDNKGCPKKVF